MAYVVELTVRVLRDLDSIYDRIHAVESPSAAAWFDGLELAISGLQGFPHRCPPAPESTAAKRKLRQLLYGKKPHVYRVIYWIDEDARRVSVLTIRHGARRPAKPRHLR